MRPLIDADILLHEVGWSGEFKDKESGEEVLLPFSKVEEILNDKVSGICKDVGATERPLLFVSASESLCRVYNRSCHLLGKEPVEFVKNFRYDVAVSKPYKGTRNNPKPFHFNNILHYILSEYDTVISEGGVEADDMMCMYQTSNKDTIICSRDKDLRICPGWHYSWECGGQRSVGPHLTDELGSLSLKNNGDVLGYGLKFFYYQMLVGDSADNIPGLPKWGKVKAYKALLEVDSHEEVFNLVKSLYKEVKGEESREYFMEQANLLWMIQQENVRYSPPKFVTNN